MGTWLSLHMDQVVVLWSAIIIVGGALYGGYILIPKDHDWRLMVPVTIKRLWAKVVQSLIPIGLGVIIFGALILGYGAYRQSGETAPLRLELATVKQQLAGKPAEFTAGPKEPAPPGRPDAGLEAAQRLKQAEAELAAAKRELGETKNRLAAAQQPLAELAAAKKELADTKDKLAAAARQSETESAALKKQLAEKPAALARAETELASAKKELA